MTAPTVRFLGGVREIGGNKVVVEDGPDRILFDFGPSFSPVWEQYWGQYLQPRSGTPVKDRLEFDLLPRVEGLYSETALTGADLPFREPEFHALFVSHAHMDHAGYLNLIDPRIPVYASDGTRALLDAISESTTTKYGDHDWRALLPGTPVRVGRLEVEPFPVDHSIPGATGFLVRTSAGTLVYTGDFRQHGPRGEETRLFVEAAASERPVGLITEGTRAGPDPRKQFSEEGVRTGVDRLLQGSRHLALVTSYPRDLDRFATMYAAARAAGRSLVVSLRTAYLLSAVHDRFPSIPLPVPGRSEGFHVYRRPKARYFPWERPLLENAVDAVWVKQHGPELLLSLEMSHFAELIDLRPESGSPYIHSMSEPFSEDDLDDRMMHRWLEHFGLSFHQYHASGHASGPELRAIVEAIRPKAVFPIHTEHPEAFEGWAPRTVRPELGEPYRLDG
ncbi:MAG TPA: MBL fold metallo-hydrolase [Thermoplasmata archaeon]|nr:MBL fold metallo-hydrolase [Thermoplasmata archaeon]